MFGLINFLLIFNSRSWFRFNFDDQETIETIIFVQFICISWATLYPTEKYSIVVQNWRVSCLKKEIVTVKDYYYSNQAFSFNMTCQYF